MNFKPKSIPFYHELNFHIRIDTRFWRLDLTMSHKKRVKTPNARRVHSFTSFYSLKWNSILVFDFSKGQFFQLTVTNKMHTSFYYPSLSYNVMTNGLENLLKWFQFILNDAKFINMKFRIDLDRKIPTRAGWFLILSHKIEKENKKQLPMI